jgi:hypothetical protein
VIVLKRSMAAGYSGLENELFYHPRASMLFVDAKKSIEGLVGGGEGVVKAREIGRYACAVQARDPVVRDFRSG